MRVSFLLLTVILFHGFTTAQVRTDRRVELTGSAPETRQVLGLPPDQYGNAALSAGVEQAGNYRFAIASIQESWEVVLPSLTTEPEAGTHLMVLIPQGATGNAHIRVNGSEPYQVVTGSNVALEALDVPDGTVLSLVFDGTRFHVMNGVVHAKRPCPDTMVQVSEHFCIDQVEREPETFFQAALRCAEEGLRLCTWTEFYQGCIRSGALGLQDMIGNHEWVDSAMNEDTYARVVGRVSCTTSGGLAAGEWQEAFRCCYSR